jgi:hypothetical protein
MDPVYDRNITITIPFGMILSLVKAKPVLSMFRDEKDVREVIKIIDAIHAGALHFIRQEDRDLLEYLADGDWETGFIPDDDLDKSGN